MHLRTLFIFGWFLTATIGYCIAESSDNQDVTKKSAAQAYLTVKDISDDGLSIILNDGSQWDIKYFGGLWKLLGWGWFEQENVVHWAVDDAIEILYPDSGNITDFVLVIHNIPRDQNAFADLKIPPSVDHPSCLWVLDFDKATNQVTLSDGTVWLKTTTDMYGTAFHKKSCENPLWEVGDALTMVRGKIFWSSILFIWNHAVNEMLYVKKVE